MPLGFARSSLFAMAKSAVSTSLLSCLTEETTITGADLPALLAASAGYLVYRLGLTQWILKPLSSFVTHPNREKQDSQRSKFIHRSFDCVHYLTVVILGISAAFLRPYGRCPFAFFGCEKYAQQTEPYVCSRIEKVYFFVFMSYYISDFPYIWTTSDVKMLIFHHIVSFALMFCAVRCGRPVITFSCNLLHDVVDVFLYLGKVLTYLNFKTLADISMLTFAATYFWLRLVNFATVIYSFWFLDVGEQRGHVWEYQACRVLVFGLLICHLIWFGLILKGLLKFATKGRQEIRDTRSDEGKKVD
jgi:hypothetical protein